MRGGKEGEKWHALHNLTVLWVGGSPGLLASAAPLLPRQLVVQLEHIVTLLCLVTCAHHQGSHVILLAEGCHLELAAPVAGDLLGTVQWLVLLVH